VASQAVISVSVLMCSFCPMDRLTATDPLARALSVSDNLHV
jgi:hypothetical protein